MSEMIGMDVEAVRRTASELRRKAGEIRAVESRVDAIVGQINGSWQGNTARRFVATGTAITVLRCCCWRTVSMVWVSRR